MEQHVPSAWAKPLLTITEAGALLSLSRATAYRAVADGSLPTITLNGKQHVRTADLIEILHLKESA